MRRLLCSAQRRDWIKRVTDKEQGLGGIRREGTYSDHV